LQSPTVCGAQRPAYGVEVRQICPPGHWEFALQWHRPLTPAGDGLQLVVDATLSQVSEPAQAAPHPPQLFSSDVMFTVLPPQQTCDASVPHLNPFGRFLQVPCEPARLHALHEPAQSELQQKPSRHRFDEHMPSRVHVPPFAFSATQLLLVLQ
jgi:hypothetical protein